MITNIAKYCKNGSLISIERKGIDPNRLQGIVLDYSNELLLFLSIYDFRPDGFSIINLNDISKIEYDATSKFQQRIIEKDGDLKKIKKPSYIQLTDWKAAIESIVAKRPILIIEAEGPECERFLIGKVVDMKDQVVVFHHFNGTGKWLKIYSKMKYQDITRLQFDTYYANKYLRHLKN